ncbi:hypothetical protein ACPOL_3931 [Acidisarcina polymorpha]|uniref:Uncharacterized protein n=1 Tax=Acidisarcina polymorpha TaxID=2211140 RepID=A0A2Z5G2G4_9BACT|nr:hypothetical protein ACPOL_3931 [Acidisarcina polymorpha]
MAAGNQTQGFSAWDTAGYIRSTSKSNITHNPQMLQVDFRPGDPAILKSGWGSLR